MLRIFLDTEFTTLAPGNKIISIALVDENEEYFYAELTDTYSLDDCSDFVKTDVLPYLRGGHYKMSHIECALKIGAWIEDRNQQCILALDNPSWDLPHLNRLLEVGWPANLIRGQYFPVYVGDLVANQLITEHGFVPHVALDDAMMMARAYKIKS